MKMNQNETRCSLNQNEIDSTLLPDINPYGGIPQNLIINTIGSSILILIFLILRKRAYKLLHSVVKNNDVQQLSHSVSSFSSRIHQSLSTSYGRDEGTLHLQTGSQMCIQSIYFPKQTSYLTVSQQCLILYAYWYFKLGQLFGYNSNLTKGWSKREMKFQEISTTARIYKTMQSICC